MLAMYCTLAIRSQYEQHLQAAGAQVFQRTKVAPSLIVVVLPANSAGLYQAVKQYVYSCFNPLALIYLNLNYIKLWRCEGQQFIDP